MKSENYIRKIMKVVPHYNEYLRDVGYYQDIIYDMFDLDYVLTGYTPTELLELTKDFDTTNSYFKDTGHDFISLEFEEVEEEMNSMFDLNILEAFIDEGIIQVREEEIPSKYIRVEDNLKELWKSFKSILDLTLYMDNTYIYLNNGKYYITEEE